MGTLEEARKRAKESSGGLFVKLADDGDKMVVVFFDDNVETEERYYDKKTSTYEPYTDKHKKEGLRPSVHFKTNVWCRTDKAVRIYQMNAASLEAMASVIEKYGRADRSGRPLAYEITRKGKAKDPKMIHLILPEAPDKALSDEEWGLVKAAVKHDLNAAEPEDDAQTDMGSYDKTKNGSAATPAAGAANGAATKPAAAPDDVVDDTVKAELQARLKMHPSDKIAAFTKRFGITKVRELKTKDVAVARALLDEFEGKVAAPPPAAAEDNPFD